MVSENTAPTGDEVAQAVPPAGQPDPEGEGQQRTFTQEDVNRLQAQTRKEVRNQFADYGQLKDRAARADELEQAQLTEQEKLEARAAEAERKAASAADQISAAMIASEVKVRASQLGIIDPDAALLLVDRANVRYSEEDGVTGVDAALTQLMEDKPYLKGQSNRAPNLNPQSGEPAPTLRLTEGQREAARLMGMTDEEYAQGI
ncbi:scaffold protein [uncultured Mediterranean phage uvDeep-CGR0-KM14-C182]|nr:scaffold protein [uncultured Mediterranean phage uvDeep-CGR0-KM14-C182]